MNNWRFNLGDSAILKSGEQGEIIGRAEYLNSEPAYFIRYTAADGRLVETWWGESAFI